jgi:hypothetical protein
VATDIGKSVTIARIDTAAGLSDKKLKLPYALQMASWEPLPVSKEALVELTLRRSLVNYLALCRQSHTRAQLGAVYLQYVSLMFPWIWVVV